MMNVVKNLVSTSLYYCECPFDMNPTRIVVHNTANDASARNEIQYMINNRNEVSYHYAIDDKEIVQGIPENRNAWHAGDGGNGIGNRQGIAIEICYSKSGGARFDAAELLAAKFIASKLKEKGWGIDKVTKHQDYSNKYCPHRTLDKGWQRFLNMIQAELGQTTPSSPSAPSTPSGEKYSTGTPICTNTLSVNCDGTGKVYKGDWSGSIGKVIKGSKYPYRVDRNGVAIGWTNDVGIDTDPHTPVGATQSSAEAIDQILHEGSYVTSVHMKIGNQGLKKIGDDLCAYLAQLGGWFPIRLVDKVPNSDGYNDNVLHTTNAVVYVSRIRVDAVNVQKNIVKIGGVWVDPTPLTEIA